MQEHQGAKYSYVAGIDGLRAMAVLAVVIYHFQNSLLPGGFVGVDVFFVISGYVISKSLAERQSSSFREMITAFYRRRFLRILPALAVMLIVVSVLQILFIPLAWLSDANRWTSLTAFFGVSNLYLVRSADGYFSQRILFNPFVHTWSLAVEEQFYLFFPFVFYLWLGSLDASASRRWRSAFLPIVASLSLFFSVWQSTHSPDRAFYLLPSRIWELAAGAILLQWQARHGLAQKIAPVGGTLLATGLILVLLALVFADDSRFPFPWALLPVVGAVCVIAAVTADKAAGPGLHAALGSAPMIYLGRISYSLYLWHWPVFVLLRWTLGMDSTATQAAALVTAFALAALSYRYVESPVRRSNYLKSLPNWKVVFGAGVATACLFLSTAVMFKLSERWGLGLTTVNAQRATWSNEAAAPMSPLSHGAVGVNRTVFIIGDSHAGAYRTMAESAAASVGAHVELYGRSGCPMASLIVAAADETQCRNFVAGALAWLKERGKPGDIVFLASLRVPRLGDQWAAFDEAAVMARSALPEEIRVHRVALMQARELVDAVRSSGMVVLMDAPMPVFRAPPFRCSDWFNRGNAICKPGFTIDRSVLEQLREPTMESLRSLKASSEVRVWDPFPVLCPGQVCSAFDGELPIFLDGDHLSGHGSRMLIPSFTKELVRIWRSPAAGATASR